MDIKKIKRYVACGFGILVWIFIIKSLILCISNVLIISKHITKLFMIDMTPTQIELLKYLAVGVWEVCLLFIFVWVCWDMRSIAWDALCEDEK